MRPFVSHVSFGTAALVAGLGVLGLVPPTNVEVAPFISGSVRLPDEAPPGDIEVELTGSDGASSALTDADGAFTFPGLRPGQYQASATRGELRGSKTIIVSEGRSGVFLFLRPPGVVRGRVVRSDGSPVMSARVQARVSPLETARRRASPRRPPQTDVYADTLSGLDGRFVLEGLQAGVLLELQARSVETGLVGAAQARAGDADVVLRVEPDRSRPHPRDVHRRAPSSSLPSPGSSEGGVRFGPFGSASTSRVRRRSYSR